MSRAVVIGLGRSGRALVRHLRSEGYDVLVVDAADGEALRAAAADLPEGCEVRLGGYEEDVAAGAALLCPSPGVPWDAPEVRWAREHGVEVRSEIDLLMSRCPAPIVGITGTNGKTTTTSLVADILRADSRRVHLGGNIGVPLLDRLGDIAASDWVVLELSSFQIETIEGEPRCRAATVLNVTPDHLDRHHSFEVYASIKERLVSSADTAVLNADDPVTRAMVSRCHGDVRLFGALREGETGCTVRDGAVVSVESAGVEEVLPVSAIPLFGAHNVANVLAATALARSVGVPPAVIASAVKAFHAVPHRLQTVADRDGVLWVNDSKATNVDAAVVALRSFPGRGIIWLGGGKHKGVGPQTLAAEVARQARAAIVFGATGPEVDAALAEAGMAEHRLVDDLEQAVAVARRIARSGDVVLLAPGYASFDQFRSYEHRGERFAEIVTAALGAGAAGTEEVR